MLLTTALLLAGTALGEIGLTVESNIQAINGEPIRLIDGHLSVGGEGPIFQGMLNDGSLVLSDRIVAPDAAGSGIGLAEDGLLIVTFDATSNFYDRDGWLDYNSQGIFGLKQVGRDYQVYANRTDLQESNPLFIEIAAIAYPSSSTALAGKTA